MIQTIFQIGEDYYEEVVWWLTLNDPKARVSLIQDSNELRFYVKDRATAMRMRLMFMAWPAGPSWGSRG